MKTIYSIIIVVVIALGLFYGVSTINNQAIENHNGDLSNESLDIISQYDSKLSTYRANFTGIDINNSEPDVSKDDDFFKEYSDLKTRFDQFKDAINLLYNIPDIVVISLTPFDEEDVNFWMELVKFMVIVVVAIAIYQGLAAKKVTED